MRLSASRLGLTFTKAIGLFTVVVAVTAALAAPPPDTAPETQLPMIRGQDIPTEPSPKPTEIEWKQARTFRPHRGGYECDLALVREWLRVTCREAPGVSLIAGNPADVTVRVTGSIFQGLRVAGSAELRLVRGESHIFSYLEMGSSESDWIGVEDGGTLSVTWREGEADPLILIHRTYDLEKE